MHATDGLDGESSLPAYMRNCWNNNGKE